MKKAVIIMMSAIVALSMVSCVKPSETLKPTDVPQTDGTTDAAQATDFTYKAMTDKPDGAETTNPNKIPGSYDGSENNSAEQSTPGTAIDLAACVNGTIEWMVKGEGIKQVKNTADLKEFFETAEAKQLIGGYEVYEFENGSFFGYVKYNQQQTGADEHGYKLGDGCTYLDDQAAKISEKLDGVTQTIHYDPNWSVFFFGKNKEDNFRLESYFSSCSEGKYYGD